MLEAPWVIHENQSVTITVVYSGYWKRYTAPHAPTASAGLHALGLLGSSLQPLPPTPSLNRARLLSRDNSFLGAACSAFVQVAYLAAAYRLGYWPPLISLDECDEKSLH